VATLQILFSFFFNPAQRCRRHADPHCCPGGPPRPGPVSLRLRVRRRRVQRGRALPAPPGGPERPQGARQVTTFDPISLFGTTMFS
jgi:hypothetical protein